GRRKKVGVEWGDWLKLNGRTGAIAPGPRRLQPLILLGGRGGAMSTLAWPLLLLAFGLLLLIAELFIPSGGLIGFLALCCFALSLARAFQESVDLGLKFLLADCLLLPLAMALAVHLWPRTPLAKRVFLPRPAPVEIEVSHSSQRLDHLIGQLGRALTP